MMDRVTSMLPLAVVGCDFRIASSSWRSRLVLSAEEARRMAVALRENDAADGFAELSTCNRNEWIVSARDPRWAASILKGQMLSRLGRGASGWFHPYEFTGEDAARHILRVAVGRESLMIGERQISGQLNDAIEKARKAGTSSRVLNGLGTAASRLVRAAVRGGGLQGTSVGVHSLAVEYLMSRLPKDGVRNVAVAGLGSIGRRVLDLLDRDPSISVTVFNRTTAKLGGRNVLPLSSLRARMGGLDAVIVCTGASEPVLKTAALKKLKTAGGLLIVDIGIPEQVERTSVKGVTIAGLDDLVKFHSNRCDSTDPVADAELERLTTEALEEFRFYCRREAFTEIIDTMQKNHGVLVHQDLPRVIAQVLEGVPGELRTGLERELRTLITGYTRGMFKTIREASARAGGRLP